MAPMRPPNVSTPFPTDDRTGSHQETRDPEQRSTFMDRVQHVDSGSTRAAFYRGPDGNSRRINRKPSNGVAQDELQHSGHEKSPSMADMADLAFALEGDNDGVYTAPSKGPNSSSRRPGQASSNRRSVGLKQLSGTRGSTPKYDSVLPEREGSPRRVARGTFETSSEFDGSLPDRDSLRYSEGPNCVRGTDGRESSGIFSVVSGGGSDFFGSSLQGAAFMKKDDSSSHASARNQWGHPIAPVGLTAANLRAGHTALPFYGATPPQSQYSGGPSQQREIDTFASMVQADYGSSTPVTSDLSREVPRPPPYFPIHGGQVEHELSDVYSLDESESLAHDETSFDDRSTWYDTVTGIMYPSAWLTRQAKFHEDGTAYFDELSGWSLAGFCRHFLYNPLSPEFTSLQQFCWAVILGIGMGFYTAGWKFVIETGLEFVWQSVPAFLLRHGVFTGLDGMFPLYHYMWICPTLSGGILSYIFVVLEVSIPDQNAWIDNVHSRGVQDYRTFWPLFFLSTGGMLSGLSLGPELPLILTAGMIGSRLGLMCKQSVLQARVMNLTAASAAVGGFFGFPMAGALFVLEVPHRNGLQFFESLSPAIIASIVAVLCNRMVTGNEVTGYYSYPFLTASLPSAIFTSAVAYGLFGAAVGIVYAKGVIKLKTLVHDLFHAPHHDDDHVTGTELDGVDVSDLGVHVDESLETLPLMGGRKATGHRPKRAPLDIASRLRKYFCCVIPKEPYRAAVAGALAGAAVGIIGMFVPHVMFWGEAQLQTLIDKGRTPLPVFGQAEEPTADLVALGYCMIDSNDASQVKAGFGMGCSLVIAGAKIVTTGLSLGTGIIAGHFWGPLFVGCAASHFLTDSVRWLGENFGFSTGLAAFPCVVILCTMGSTHVVTFRAHTAIMLILTLTISAFDPEDGANGNLKVAGDYSAVFPLLVVSVFISLMATRDTVFYKSQRSRGDIMAVPEVLCEPGLEGRPLVVDYEVRDQSFSFTSSRTGGSELELAAEPSPNRVHVRKVEESITQNDIERAFEQRVLAAPSSQSRSSPSPPPPPPPPPQSQGFGVGMSQERSGSLSSQELKPPLSSSRLDELLARPMDESVEAPVPIPGPRSHRRTQSAPIKPKMSSGRRARAPSSGDKEKKALRPELERVDSFRFDVPAPARERSNSGSSRGSFVRVDSYGELQDHQPSLLDQARLRSATTSAVDSFHRRVPSLPSSRRHSRKNSDSSFGFEAPPPSITHEDNTISLDELDTTFKSAFGRNPVAFGGASPWSNQGQSGSGSSS